MTDVTQYRSRFVILFLLFAVPFLRMLLEHRYGFLHLEVLAALILIAAPVAVLAGIARTRTAFHVLVVGSAVMLSVNAIQVNFLPDARVRWIIVGLTAFLIAALLLLRTHFYRILLIFLLGSCLGDVANAVTEYAGTHRSGPVREGRGYEHIVHIILDEMAGLGAIPRDCRECVQAADAFHRSLERSHFKIYPFAFSNYQSTRDSIPSILNGRILGRTEEYLPDGEYPARPFLRKNRYFESFLAKNYAIRAYQSDFLLFDAPEYETVRSRTYKANSLSALHAIKGSWLLRLKQLYAIFLQSDRFWWTISIQVLPLRFVVERIDVGPVAIQDVFPDHLLDDYRSATQNTLFLVHLLTPHHPYVYKSDGSPRELPELIAQRVLLTSDVTEHRRLYAMYGEQMQYLASQIDKFLESLKQEGMWETTTVIIHGDHGSRLRLLKPSQGEEFERLQGETKGLNPMSRYDYVGEPDLSDLLNRFGTLLAIKPPRSRSSETVTEVGSVLYFLEQFYGPWSDVKSRDEVNSVYLFNADRSPRRIPIVDVWQRARREDSTNHLGE